MEYNSVIDVLVWEGRVYDAYHFPSQMTLEVGRPDTVGDNGIPDGFMSGFSLMNCLMNAFDGSTRSMLLLPKPYIKGL